MGATPVVTFARVVPSFLAWMYLVTFFYNGEPFDYIFEAGAQSLTESQAQANVLRNGYFLKAQAMFLREVPVGPEFNDVEIRTA